MHNHDDWLKKAARDLRVSKILLKEIEFESSLYNTQQSAEKSFKAFLAFKKQSIPKTHNLVLLIDLCIKLDKELDSIAEYAEILNPFSVAFRYPDDVTEPDKYDVEQACIMAEKIYKFIKEKIVDLEHGQRRIKFKNQPA